MTTAAVTFTGDTATPTSTTAVGRATGDAATIRSDTRSAPRPDTTRSDTARLDTAFGAATRFVSAAASPASGFAVTARCRNSRDGLDPECSRCFFDDFTEDPPPLPSPAPAAARSFSAGDTDGGSTAGGETTPGAASTSATRPGDGSADESPAEPPTDPSAEPPAGSPRDFDEPDESDEEDDAPEPPSSGDPHATPGLPDMTVPTPNATANAPTRPMQLAHFIAVLPGLHGPKPGPCPVSAGCSHRT